MQRPFGKTGAERREDIANRQIDVDENRSLLEAALRRYAIDQESKMAREEREFEDKWRRVSMNTGRPGATAAADAQAQAYANQLEMAKQHSAQQLAMIGDASQRRGLLRELEGISERTASARGEINPGAFVMQQLLAAMNRFTGASPVAIQTRGTSRRKSFDSVDLQSKLDGRSLSPSSRYAILANADAKAKYGR